MNTRTAIVGGYAGWAMAVHIILTITSIGMWFPVFLTYLICCRKRTIQIHWANDSYLMEIR